MEDELIFFDFTRLVKTPAPSATNVVSQITRLSLICLNFSGYT